MSEELENSIDDINLDDFNFDDLIEEADISDGNQDHDVLSDVALDETVDLDVSFDDAFANVEDVELSSDVDVNSEIEMEKEEPFFEGSSNENEISSVDNNFLNDEDVIVDGDNIFEDISSNTTAGDIVSNGEFVSEFQDETISNEDMADENIFSGIEAEKTTGSDFYNDGSLNSEYDNIDIASEPSSEFLSEEVVDNNYVAEQSINDFEVPEGFFEEEPMEEEIVQEEFTSDEVNDDVHNEYFDNGEEEIVAPSYIEDVNVNSNMGVLLSQNVGQLQWYSGTSNDNMFEISKGFESGTFDADEECKTIHVNVGYDTYGWEVQFSDGLVMNLRDVREYQIRNGKLPNSDGRIVFGQSALMFSGVERIVIYENIKYFSYGI